MLHCKQFQGDCVCTRLLGTGRELHVLVVFLTYSCCIAYRARCTAVLHGL